MELDDLKRTWDEYDRKLDAAVRLNASLLRGAALARAETALSRLARLLAVEVVLLFGVALLLGSFLWDHGAKARFLIPAVTLQLCVIALVIAGIRQILAIHRIDYGAPIVAIQKRLELLRVERIQTNRWVLLLAPLAWTPLAVVAMKGLFGVDIQAAFGAAWLGANLAFGLLVVAVGVWVSRRYAERFQRSRLIGRLMDDLGGYNLTAATGFLRSLSQFEEEPEAEGAAGA